MLIPGCQRLWRGQSPTWGPGAGVRRTPVNASKCGFHPPGLHWLKPTALPHQEEAGVLGRGCLPTSAASLLPEAAAWAHSRFGDQGRSPAAVSKVWLLHCGGDWEEARYYPALKSLWELAARVRGFSSVGPKTFWELLMLEFLTFVFRGQKELTLKTMTYLCFICLFNKCILFYSIFLYNITR